MTVTLPEDKMNEIVEMCTELLNAADPSIRQVARVIGKMVSTFPAVQFGPLHYRDLEKDKIRALQINKGHFDRYMALSGNA